MSYLFAWLASMTVAALVEHYAMGSTREEFKETIVAMGVVSAIPLIFFAVAEAFR